MTGFCQSVSLVEMGSKRSSGVQPNHSGGVAWRSRPTPVIGQDHHCRSAASPYRTFMAPRSIVQGPKVSGAGHSRHSPRRSDLCRDRETFCWMGGKQAFAACASRALPDHGSGHSARIAPRNPGSPAGRVEAGSSLRMPCDLRPPRNSDLGHACCIELSRPRRP